MIGLFKRSLAASLCAVARLRCIFVPIGALAIGAMFLWTGFGVVFNYTHSAPFGLYREEFDSEAAIHDPAPYVFFCPDRRWPSMRGEPNYRDPMRTCPDGFSPLIKPVVAWPAILSWYRRMASASMDAHCSRFQPRSSATPKASSFVLLPTGEYRVGPKELWVVSSVQPAQL